MNVSDVTPVLFRVFDTVTNLWMLWTMHTATFVTFCHWLCVLHVCLTLLTVTSLITSVSLHAWFISSVGLFNV